MDFNRDEQVQVFREAKKDTQCLVVFGVVLIAGLIVQQLMGVFEDACYHSIANHPNMM